MYHPAAALRRGELRAAVEADFARIPALLGEARSGGAPASAPPAAAPAAADPRPRGEQRALL